MKTATLFIAETIALSQSVTSGSVNLRGAADDGFFGIQLVLTGDGTAKVEYLESYNSVNFVTPSGAIEIVTGFTKTSGTSGVDVLTFEPEVCPYMKIKVTETGGANSITVTVILVVQ